MHLSKYMADNELDDDAVAAGIGRNRVTVSRIRRKKLRPDWETIKRIRLFTNGMVTADDFENIEVPGEKAGSGVAA
jgi:hypothetical protein